MTIDYSIAAPFSDQVRALCIVESGEQPIFNGDGGRAFGILHMHPATFQEYYGRSKNYPASVTDTWTEAQIRACASFWSMWEHLGTDLVVQAWNQGIRAVVSEGVRVPDYLAKYSAALNKVRAVK